MMHNCNSLSYNKEDFITPILKVTENCNFSCDFCRYHLNERKRVMDFETYKAVVGKACDYNMSHGWKHLNVIYHGGEPLLWGIQNFERSVAFQEELKKKHPGISIINNIQTNGSLLNQQWIGFLKEKNFHIGVSIDGPDEINFHKNHSGNNAVIHNIHELNHAGCNFGILSVITNAHKGYANQYYDFLIENSIHSVGFCYCVYDDKQGITVDNGILSDFLIAFFNRYYFGNYHLRVREFEYVMQLCLGASTNACTFSFRNKCGYALSILPNGDVFFCDPYSFDAKTLGNILINDFFEIQNSKELITIVTDAKESARHECDKCEIHDICGGGCYRHVLSNGKNAFCETFKVLYPHIRQIVSNSV